VKSILQELQCEIGLITDQMDRVSRHGQLICQRTRDEHEQQLVRTTLSNLTDQLQQVRSWLEEKKLQVRPDPILSLRIPIPTFHPIRPEFLFSFFSIFFVFFVRCVSHFKGWRFDRFMAAIFATAFIGDFMGRRKEMLLDRATPFDQFGPSSSKIPGLQRTN
jgi:hypothetical protein